MHDIKKLAVIIALLAAFLIAMEGFVSSDIQDRAIILGMGVDLDGAQIKVTTEVVSPGNGAEEVGTYSKTIHATGKSIVDALKTISEYCGKEASLGQCVLIVIGKSFAQSQYFASALDFFVLSQGLRETCSICFCDGEAAGVLTKADAIGKSVSLSLSSKFLQQASSVGVPTNNLISFCRSQAENEKSGFLNVVKCISTSNDDSQNPSVPQVVFDIESIAVFKDSKYKGTLSSAQADGLSLLNKKTFGQLYLVLQDGTQMTLQVGQKKVDVKVRDKSVDVKVTLKMRLLETDLKNSESSLEAKSRSRIRQETLKQVQREAEEQIASCLAVQNQYNCDLVGFHELLRQKYGSSEELFRLLSQDIPCNVSVSVENT